MYYFFACMRASVLTNVNNRWRRARRPTSPNKQQFIFLCAFFHSVYMLDEDEKFCCNFALLANAFWPFLNFILWFTLFRRLLFSCKCVGEVRMTYSGLYKVNILFLFELFSTSTLTFSSLTKRAVLETTVAAAAAGAEEGKRILFF